MGLNVVVKTWTVCALLTLIKIKHSKQYRDNCDKDMKLFRKAHFSPSAILTHHKFMR